MRSIRPKKILLPNAEPTEDLIEHGFRRFFTCNFAQGPNGATEVNGPEIEGELIGNGNLHLL